MITIADIRKLMEGAVGRLSPAKAQELAKSLKQGQGKEQVQKAAHDLLEWSNKNRQRITEVVRTEVKSQLGTMGVASKDELDALKKRVRELERAQAPARKRTTTKRTTAKRTTAKPAARPAETSAPAPGPEGASA